MKVKDEIGENFGHKMGTVARKKEILEVISPWRI